jgi:DNA replication protein DnaC
LHESPLPAPNRFFNPTRTAEASTVDLMNYLAGGAALGLVAGFWEKIKAVLWRAVSLFVKRVEVNSEHAHNALVSYLVAHHTRSGLYDCIYGAWHESQADGRCTLVPYEVFGNRNVVFWDRWFPFLFSNAQEKQTNAANQQQGNYNAQATRVFCTLTFLRGTVNVEKLLTAACRHCDRLNWDANDAQERQRNRFAIHYVPERTTNEQQHHYNRGTGLPWFQLPAYRLLAHAPDQLGRGARRTGSALANLLFPVRVKQLIREVEMWRSSRQWYQEHGIPWKRGWLLYGPPGTGKTALARAFAEDLNLPIYVFNLAALDNHELMEAWADMQVNVPCIALLEDFDNVFHGRENVSRRHSPLPLVIAAKDNNNQNDARPRAPLTFDCLLNCLDGVERSDGIFTIITTNDLARIDPALGQPRQLPDGTIEFISTRPGRLDKAIELTYMEPQDKREMALRILGDYPEEYATVLEFIERYPELKETPAQFQERCAQIALRCFWQEQSDLAPRRRREAIWLWQPDDADELEAADRS